MNLLAWFIPKEAACEAATPNVPRPPKLFSSESFDAALFDAVVVVRADDEEAVVVVEAEEAELFIDPAKLDGNANGFIPPPPPPPNPYKLYKAKQKRNKMFIKWKNVLPPFRRI